MKTIRALAYLAAAGALACLALGTGGQALAAPPAPACDLHLANRVSDAQPLLGSDVRFTLTATAKCNVDAVVRVDDPQTPGLAQNPPGEPLHFQFGVPRDTQVTRVFTVGMTVPGADDCRARFTNVASAAAQLPQGEGALAFTTASVTLTTRCVTPGLPATGRRA